jgi:hypothetical protein
MTSTTPTVKAARFVAIEIDVPGRRFYVRDGITGRNVGRAWGAKHLAKKEAARRNDLYRQAHD